MSILYFNSIKRVYILWHNLRQFFQLIKIKKFYVYFVLLFYFKYNSGVPHILLIMMMTPV